MKMHNVLNFRRKRNCERINATIQSVTGDDFTLLALKMLYLMGARSIGVGLSEQ